MHRAALLVARMRTRARDVETIARTTLAIETEDAPEAVRAALCDGALRLAGADVAVLLEPFEQRCLEGSAAQGAPSTRGRGSR